MTKYVFAQPSIPRFKWELFTVCKSLVDLGVHRKDIVILFADNRQDISKYFESFDTHVYKDTRKDKTYIPSLRPFLWMQYLSEDPARQDDTYVYLDSDVVILSLDAFKVPANENNWYCSNTIGYIGYDYLQSVSQAPLVLDTMSRLTGVPIDWVKSIQKNSGGAQWVMVKPKIEYWKFVYEKSVELHHAFEKIDTSLQKWTAEMWAQLWGLYHWNIEPHVDKHLDFAWTTDKIENLTSQMIIHNAGIGLDHGVFFKGNYMKTPPIDDLYQESGLISDVYVEYVRKANYGK